MHEKVRSGLDTGRFTALHRLRRCRWRRLLVDDDIDVCDDRDDAHRGAAVGTLERIDLVRHTGRASAAGRQNVTSNTQMADLTANFLKFVAYIRRPAL